MADSQPLINTERSYVPVTGALTVACGITGLVTYLFSSHSIWLQWSVLFHLLTGIICSFALLPYLGAHFRRTIGFRRSGVLLSGLTTILLFIGFAYSGWHITLRGQQESEQWIYVLHVVSAVLFLLLVLVHVVLHARSLPEKRKKRNQSRYPGVPEGSIKSIVKFNVILQLLIGFSALVYWLGLEPYQTSPVVDDYEYSYGEHRFRPSQTETANNAFIDQRQIANSHRCLGCHEDVGRQWMSSVHRQAASDPTYVTNVNLLAENEGISATRYCEGCHAPVALLSGELSPGGKHGGVANTAANREGISCMGCHGIVSLKHLKGVASFLFKPAEDYLFEQSQSPLLRAIHDLLLRTRPDQHRKDLGKSIQQDSKMCSACHTQFMDKDMNDWGWVKMQDEYSAWLKSPFSNQHQEGYSNDVVRRCQDCHMPLVNSSDPSADVNGQIRSHHFPGSNTFLPLLRGDQKQLDETRKFLQSNKIRVSIDKPNREDALQTLHALDENLRNFEEAPFYFYLGEQADIYTVISNRGVGHDFPGGSIDINQVWVEFLAMDAEGELFYHSGLIDEENIVDPESYFYRSLPVDRHGKLVWKHDLFNMVGESFKRVIKAGESDIVHNRFRVPAWAKSPITVTATVKYRKLNERYARWALKERYIKIPVVNVAWDSLDIPIKTRKEVE
ncbi:MAG: hypothetical protein GY814_13180 [Gammaproteobacteria bacterium]|nr:hypothetical protein [Gammaproteobacteria bacterium]